MINAANVGTAASYEEVCRVSVPLETESYWPITNKDLIDLARQQAPDLWKEHYFLSKDKQKMIAYFTPSASERSTMEVLAVVNSYNKQVTTKVSLGTAFYDPTAAAWAGIYDSIHTHTKMRRGKSGWPKFEALASQLISKRKQFRVEKGWLWRGISGRAIMDLDEGYSLIGRAMGQRVLSSNQIKVVLKGWDSARPDKRNCDLMRRLFAIALLKGDPFKAIDRSLKASQFLFDEASKRSVTPEMWGADEE